MDNQCQWLVRTARLNRHRSKDQENDAITHIDLTTLIAVPMTAVRLDEVIVGAEVNPSTRWLTLVRLSRSDTGPPVLEPSERAEARPQLTST
jgi:hypothetical protein